MHLCEILCALSGKKLKRNKIRDMLVGIALATKVALKNKGFFGNRTSELVKSHVGNLLIRNS